MFANEVSWRPRCSVTFAAIVSLFAIASASMSSAQAPPPKPAPRETQRGQYGDVQVLNSDHIQGKADLSTATVTGPKTIVIVPDKESKSVLRMHADTIIMKKVGQFVPGTIELFGNVTYHIVQKYDKGERLVDGTAGHGFYSRPKNRIILTEGVRGAITDVERLAEPGTYRAASADIMILEAGNRYRMSGGASDELRFIPKESVTKTRPKPKRLGVVDATRFQNADLIVGETAVFRGPETTVDYDDPSDGTRARLQGPLTTATYTKDHVTLSHIIGTGTVRYNLRRPSVDKQSERGVTGVASVANYDAVSGDMLLVGAVDAYIIDSAGLARPAHVIGERMFAHKSAEVYHFDLTGGPNAFTRFTPKPKPVSKENPPPTDTFPIGDVTVTRYETGHYNPDMDFEFRGSGVKFVSNDQPTRTSTEFLGDLIVGTLSAINTIIDVTATGNVHFYAQRPSTAPKAAPTSMETISGTAIRAKLLNDPDHKNIKLDGPMRTEMSDPETLEKPGVLVGLTGDTVTLNLSSTPYEFDVVSPNQTVTVDFQPKDRQPDEPAPKPKPKKKRT